MKTQLHILFTMLLSAGIGLFILLLAVGTAAAQQTLFTIEDAGGTVVLRVLDDGTVVTEKLDLQGGEGALQCTGCITSGRLSDEAVESDNIADSAVQPQHIAFNSIDGGHVADGSLTAADIGEPLYTTKPLLSENSNTSSITSVAGTVVATCADANDLAISAACDLGGAASPLTLKSIRYQHWSSSTNAAQVECVVQRSGTSAVDATASIYCLEVP